MADNYDVSLRSKESVERAFITLINTSQRTVSVCWINYNSKLIQYSRLEPDATVPLNTYSTHPWIFKDMDTNELMHVEHKEVFWPKPWILTKEVHRNRVYIHFPLRSLRAAAMWSIISLIPDEAQIRNMGLPKSLEYELCDLLNTRYDIGSP